jgi:hypothetical protein
MLGGPVTPREMLRPMRKTPLSWPVLLGLCVALLLAGGSPARADLTESEFKKLSAEAKKLMKRGGESLDKRRAVEALSKADSAASVELLVQWALASEAERSSRLVPAAEKLKAKYEDYLAKLVKKQGENEENWSEAGHKRLGTRREKYDAANRLVVNELNLQGDMARGLRATKDPAAIAWLAQAGVPSLLASGGVLPVLEGCVDVLLKQPAEVAGPAILGAIERELSPARHIRAIEWVGLGQLVGAAKSLAPALAVRSILVRRAAVRAYGDLNEPASVPFLIGGLKTASGLLAAEIEDALHKFTNRTHEGDYGIWTKWWEAEGEAWLAAGSTKRYEKRAAQGDPGFYGIPTPSTRIVFVLDRSDSMRLPIPHKGTGVKADEASKLKLAKEELSRAIVRLASNVKFNVIFYNHEIKTWKPAPRMVAATRDNKQKARKWFMSQKHAGSTALFGGLSRALNYSEKFGADYSDDEDTGDEEPAGKGGGVDTIFLLSDGQPTNAKDKLMKPEELEAALANFFEENKVAHCVVHTIGIGPDHDDVLMRRIAEETGGQYVGIGK